MSEVKERLLNFISYKGLNKNKFEKMCGLSSRYVSNISVSIQPDTVKKISLAFPDLNTTWLITGDGEMLKNGQQVQNISNNNGTAINGHHISVEKETRAEADYRKLIEQIDRLIEQNNRLLSIIENLTK